jgi:protein AroM
VAEAAVELIGLVTLGQAPREDVVGDLRARLGDGVEVREAGALDGAGLPEIRALAPATGDDPLVSRLRDGTEVTVGKRALTPRLQAALSRVAEGAGAVAILCAGSFPELDPPRCPMVLPEPALRMRLAARFGGAGTLGVVAPLRAQADAAPARWGGIAARVESAVASPYRSEDELDAAARSLADRGADLVLLDCMGFVERHRARVAALVGREVLTPSVVLADALGELA